MAKNIKQTSSRVATLAAETLQKKSSSQVAKQLAGAALAQSRTGKQTGAEMEELAGRVLESDKYAADTKKLAASVVSQSNKNR